jgi:hypothetical protein
MHNMTHAYMQGDAFPDIAAGTCTHTFTHTHTHTRTHTRTYAHIIYIHIHNMTHAYMQGDAFLDIAAGTYYPAASLYMAGHVTYNFGPEFKFPMPEVGISLCAFMYVPTCVYLYVFVYVCTLIYIYIYIYIYYVCTYTCTNTCALPFLRNEMYV